jgi:hypothetical protein
MKQNSPTPSEQRLLHWAATVDPANCNMMEKIWLCAAPIAGSCPTSTGGERIDQSRPGPKLKPLIEPTGGST